MRTLGAMVGIILLGGCDGGNTGTSSTPSGGGSKEGVASGARAQGGSGDTPVAGLNDTPVDPGFAMPAMPSGVSDSVKRGLPATFLLPRAVSMGVTSSRGMLVEAVYYATAMTGAGQLGQVTSTGTIDVTQAGAQYQPTPTDKLLVNMGGQKHEFVLKQVQGNNQAATAAEWLLSPHSLQYTHRIPEQAEADVSVQYDGQRFDVKTKGWAMLAGQRFEVDLAAAGGTAGTRDLGGQDTQTQYTLTGSITGGGLDVKVNEQHTVSTVSDYSAGLLQSQRGSASQFNAVVNSALTCDGSTFAFQGVRVQLNTKDKGGTSSSDVVAMEGIVLRDDQPYATCGLQSGIPMAVVGNEVIRLDGAGGS